MNIHITVITYLLAPQLEALFAHANGPDVYWHLFRHSQNAAVKEACERIFLTPDYRVDYKPYGVNRGLAKTWNDGLLLAQLSNADVSMVISDDIDVDYAGVKRLAQFAYDNSEYGLVTADGLEHNGYNMFVVNKIALETIGLFDENFFPIFWEDVDYSRRLWLAGVPQKAVEGVNVRQHLINGTLKASPELQAQHKITYPLNEAYYRRKWGDIPPNKMYNSPFNDESVSLRIDYQQRDAPYGPGRDRTDKDIVKV